MLLIFVFLAGTEAYAASPEYSQLVTDNSAQKVTYARPEEEQLYPTIDSLFSLYQPYIMNISSYKPIYFLIGTDPAKSKFQFSFKYRFFNANGSLVKRNQWLAGLHFGYTQTSFWNLKDESLPFEDTSYKPELFHRTTNISIRPSWLQGMFIQTGVKHESNGQAGELSRNTNYFYIEPVLVFFNKESRLGFGFSPRILVYFDNSHDNPDLADYRGYFELKGSVGTTDSLVMTSLMRYAKEGGSVEIDLSYPLGQNSSDNLNIYIHMQYVNTLAESLLYYRDRTEALRIGITFIR